MATLLASPPTGLPEDTRTSLFNIHDEQAETIALVDNLPPEWLVPQSQTTSLDRLLYADEPSSYPFSAPSNWTHLLSGIPYFEVIQDASSGEFPFQDFDLLENKSGQTPLFHGNTHQEAFVDVPLTTITTGNIELAQSLLPGSLSSESASTNGEDICPGLHNRTFSSMNNDILFAQNISFDFNIGSVQCAPSCPGTKLLNAKYCTENTPQRTIQNPPLSSQTQGLAPLLTQVHTTPMPPSRTSVEAISTLVDEHYSNTSSRWKRQKVKELQHNNKLQYRDATGAVIGAQFTLGYDKVIRQPYSEMDKAKTKATRKRDACEPCKINKKRCNRPESEYECCNNCISKVFTMPCFIAKIIDAQLFVTVQPSPTHPRSALRQTIFESLTDICHHPQRQRPKIVNLTQGLGLQMLVVLARYNGMPGEATHRVWKKDGQVHRIEMPPYCIASMQDAQRHMLEYVANFRSAWIKHVLGSSNEITRILFDQAQRFAAFSPNSTVSKALDLCAASRIIERDWRFCGGFQNLDIPIVSDDDGTNIIPITPMMDAQLDQIVIHSFLIPIRDTLLTSLQYNMTSQSNQSTFFETFLTISVLLSHAEWLLTHSRRSALRVGSKTRYNSIPRAESYFHACNTLLAYWHHMCKGVSLVEMKWRDKGPRKWAGLDAEQVEFLEDLKRRINLEGSTSMMRHLREDNMYESELYWCHQLFFPNWKAGAKAVEEVTIIDSTK